MGKDKKKNKKNKIDKEKKKFEKTAKQTNPWNAPINPQVCNQDMSNSVVKISDITSEKKVITFRKGYNVQINITPNGYEMQLDRPDLIENGVKLQGFSTTFYIPCDALDSIIKALSEEKKRKEEW